MTAARTKAAGLVVLVALALVLSGCGGFGTKKPATLDTSIKNYVALGDGFAAAPYAGRTTSTDGCLRSSGSYPRQVAKALGVADFKDVSCVGATTKAITQPFRPAGAKKSVKAQLDAVGKDTDLVTISIGIENSNLLGSLFNICVALPCGNQVPLSSFAEILPTVAKDVTSVIRAVTTRAPQAYVVVIGYPELIPLSNHCKSVPRMNQTQWYWTNQVWQQFSTEVGSSARQAGAAYVDARKLTGAHPPCAAQPWVNGARTVPGKSIAYHPKAIEQKVVAQAVAASVRTR